MYLNFKLQLNCFSMLSWNISVNILPFMKQISAIFTVQCYIYCTMLYLLYNVFFNFQCFIYCTTLYLLYNFFFKFEYWRIITLLQQFRYRIMAKSGILTCGSFSMVLIFSLLLSNIFSELVLGLSIIFYYHYNIL